MMFEVNTRQISHSIWCKSLHVILAHAHYIFKIVRSPSLSITNRQAMNIPWDGRKCCQMQTQVHILLITLKNLLQLTTFTILGRYSLWNHGAESHGAYTSQNLTHKLVAMKPIWENLNSLKNSPAQWPKWLVWPILPSSPQTLIHLQSGMTQVWPARDTWPQHATHGDIFSWSPATFSLHLDTWNLHIAHFSKTSRLLNFTRSTYQHPHNPST